MARIRQLNLWPTQITGEIENMRLSIGRSARSIRYNTERKNAKERMKKGETIERLLCKQL